jgi:fructokinase
MANDGYGGGREVKEEDVIVAAVEGGGTTFVVSLARIIGPSESKTDCERFTDLQVLKTHTISSELETPQHTLDEVANFLRVCCPRQGYAALGIACFGPIGLNRSKDYGCILASCPKKAWRGVDIVTPLLEACGNCPHAIETDVNAPALAEYWVARTTKGEQISSTAYVTVGTGVGIGLVVNDKPVHGFLHPEGGHVCIQPLQTNGSQDHEGYSWGTERSPYKGVQTVEGVTSSVALTERLLKAGALTNSDVDGDVHAAADLSINRDALKDVPDDHEVWDHSANALANLCVTLILITSVERIVLGGGVMKRSILFPKIRRRVLTLLNNYLELPHHDQENGMDQFITGSTWGDRGGLVGTLLLARSVYLAKKEKETAVTAPKSDDSAFTMGVVHGIILGVGLTLAALNLVRKR